MAETLAMDGRQKSPEQKMKLALKLAQEALEDEGRERKELAQRFDALRSHVSDLKAGIEVIVTLAMMEDTDDRSPDEVVNAVMARLVEPPN